MASEDLNRIIADALAEIGEKRLIDELKTLIDSASNDESGCLTIVANKGAHHLPAHLMRGEVYFASEGSLDFSSAESVKRELIGVLEKLASKLKQRAWKRIYLVPFGPSNLSILIKLLVFRVTHLETVDMFHVGTGAYFELDIPLRPVVVAAQ